MKRSVGNRIEMDHAKENGGLRAERRLRVALFTDADVFAGTERHMLELARALRERGVDVAVACPAGSPLATRALSDGISAIPIAKQGLVDWRAIAILRRLLR